MGAPQYEQAGADIGGTGTTGTIPVWTGPSTLGDSLLSQSGAIVTNSGTFRAANGTFSEPAYTFSASSGTGMYRATSGALLRFAVSGAYAFGVDTNGNVGIGTASPAARVNVDGNAVYNNTATQAFRVSNGSTRVVDIGYDSGLEKAFIQSVQLGTAYRDLLLAPNGGNVGIGTASPDSRLHVNGTAARLRVDLGGGGNNYYDAALHYFRSFASAAYVTIGPSSLDASATAGYGLKLPATPGNPDTQTLDCYQENTGWTPGISFGGASTGITYDTQAGSWTKIGNLVFVTGRIKLTSKGTATGVARLTNLPVAVGAGNFAAGGGSIGFVTNITFGGMLGIYPVSSQTVLGFTKNTSAGATADLTDADFQNTTDFSFTCIYRV